MWLLLAASLLPLLGLVLFAAILCVRGVIIVGQDAIVGRVVPVSGIRPPPYGLSARSLRYYLGDRTQPCLYSYFRVGDWCYNVTWYRGGVVLDRKGRFKRR